jgi:hypothetical protein
MLKAYETEGHGIYWQVYRWKAGDTLTVGDFESLDEVMKYAREQELPLTLYTQEWYEKLQREGGE